jgi:regulator of protease activity HflC (stomatin/prohibitin superfamily)
MFERLIDLLLQSIAFFIPFVVIDHFEEAVVLRFGKFHRKLGPGFHWIIPFQVERCIADNVVPRTLNLAAQSLTTKEGRMVLLGGVVTAAIRDIQKATLEVEGVDHALQDSCYGAIGALVAAASWEEIQHEDFSEALTKACRKQAWRFGIEIQRVQLSDLTLSKTLRIVNNA